MTYVDSSNDWYLALQYGYPGTPRNGYPFVNIPLPGHMPGVTFEALKPTRKYCDLTNISWEYDHRNCFELALTLAKISTTQAHEYYEAFDINQQP